MKEIKHKVWDRENQEWLIYKKEIIGWMCPINKPNIPLKLWMYFSKDGAAFSELQECINSEHFEVVQYTGLKDKNSKPIYEGDIVKSGKRNFEIVFSDGSFMMCFANGVSMMFINEMVEIIGDIYKNPELLGAVE